MVVASVESELVPQCLNGVSEASDFGAGLILRIERITFQGQQGSGIVLVCVPVLIFAQPAHPDHHTEDQRHRCENDL